MNGSTVPHDADIVAACEFMKRLSHPVRLMLVTRLARGEALVSDFETELGLRQPGLSQQLAELRNAGLVETHRDAKGALYRLTDARRADVLRIIRCLLPNNSARTPVESAAPKFGATIHQLFGAAVFAKVGER